MKTLAATLSAVVIALAGFSAYLTWQRGIERSRADQAEARVAALEARLRTVERERASLSAGRASTPTPTSTGSIATSTPPKSSPPVASATFPPGERRQRPVDRSASTRALMRAESIDELRNQYRGLGRVLGMSDREVEEFIAFLADQTLRQREAWANSPPKPNPNPQGPPIATFDLAASLEQQKREQIERLGEERWQKFNTYREGASDRRQVQSLRNRLTDSNALTDAQAESLALALQEDREQYAKQIKDEIGPNATFTTVGVNGRRVMTNVSSSDEDGQEKQLVEQLETFNRRAHDRAETLLTPEQLKAFDQMQEVQLTSARMRIRSMRETPPAK